MFQPFEFDLRGQRIRLGENEIHYHNKKKNYSICFNQHLSNEVREKGFTKILVGQDDMTGEVGFFINKEDGIPLSFIGGSRGKNIQFQGKRYVERIGKALSIQDKDCILTITENLSINPKGMFFKIIGRRH